MNFLAPYLTYIKIGAVVLLLAVVGRSCTVIERNAWEAKIAVQKAEAERIGREREQKNRELDNANAEHIRDLDAAYQAALADAAAGRADFERSAAERLRNARRGQSCGNVVPGSAVAPGSVPDAALRSDDGLRRNDPRIARAGELRAAIKTLQALVRDECYPFIQKYGR